MTGAPLSSSGVSAEDVVAFLRAHPRFLAEHPELYRILAPPLRVHGDTLADHMAAMLRAERAHATAMAERADGVLAAGRAAAGLAARVQEAVLAMIGAANAAECVSCELPALLAIDAASLCIEADLPGARLLPPGAVASLLGPRAVVFRAGAADAPLLHGEAARLARYDALVRIPGEGPPALLALVARDRHALEPSQGTGALAFLGRAVAVALGR
ncbi:DUF484 family protein [Limobrevibacterium gyesilva]|uniref:DUF484 family protein n=1 Tax=Limobrevibacterium gyesilva TaxID=2991712 RepID=A0AA42CEM0_9PROT|nr:DUF484 family protein [Limobrevibacterium gyesilva]MCW3473701.1 DUF484 family protein [Limobrevibacterium gyesilva]